MNKQRKTSHILNVFQYDETTGAVTLPSTLVLTAPASNDNSTKVGTTAWVRTYVSGLSYLTGNQSITVSGDATGSGTTSIALTLANTAVTPGTYGSTTLVPVVTVDSKGRITSVTTAAISGSLTFTGDVTGTGTTGTSTAMTLAASGVTAGTYTKVTVDTKGRVTVGASATTSDISEGTNLYYTDARVLSYLSANTYATQSYVGTQIANLVASSPAALDTLNELAAALGNDASFSTTISTALGNRLRVDINNQGLSATLQGYGRTNLGLGTAATSNTGDFVAYRTFGTAANNNTGDFALASHTHSIANVTGLQTALDGKQASLGFTPYNSTNPSSYITSSSLTSYVPYTGATANIDTGGYSITAGAVTLTSNLWLKNTGTYDFIISNATSVTTNTIRAYYNTSDELRFYAKNTAGGSVVPKIMVGDGTTFYTIYHTGNIPTIPTNNNQLTNGAGYITSSGSISGSAGSVAWTNVTGRPTALSSFTNDLGNYGSWITSSASISGNAGSVTYLMNRTDSAAYPVLWGANYTNTIGTIAYSCAAVTIQSSTGTLSATTFSGALSGNATTASSISGYNNPTTAATANTIVYRDASGDIYTRYFLGGYINTSDNVDTGTITYIMAKFGDNYHRSATAAKVQSFLGLGSAAYQNTGAFLSSSGSVTVGGYLTVTGAGTSSSIYMSDSDEGNREIHCNSNRIGFLTQAGSWGAYCDDSGNWAAANFSGSSSGTNTGDQTNISGNAATATSAGYLTGGDSSAYMILLNANAGDLNTYNTAGLYSSEYNGSTNRPIESNGHWIQISDAGGTDVKTQWYYQSNGAGIYMRLMWGNGTWRAWRTLITDSNIGSQSVSYASSAGSANAVAWTNVSSRPTTTSAFTNDSGFITSGSNVVGLYSSGFGNGNFTWYQSPGGLQQYTGSWASFLISNHGAGVDYYNQTIIMPFWGAPQYMRKEGNNNVGPWTFYTTENLNPITTSNIGSQSVSYAATAGSATTASSASTAGSVTGASTMSGYLTVSANWGTSPYTSAFTIIGTYPSITLRNSQADWEYLMHNDGAGDLQFYFGAGYTVNSWTQRYTFGRYGDFTLRTGSLTASGDITAYSDIRVKENIEVIENALEKVKAIRGVTFNRTDLENDKGARHAGVIAQEVLEVLPEVVRTNDKGMYSVAYGNMVGLLIEAVKEQQLQIEELKNKLDNVLSSR
jgi:hypothetical protein